MVYPIEQWACTNCWDDEASPVWIIERCDVGYRGTIWNTTSGQVLGWSETVPACGQSGQAATLPSGVGVVENGQIVRCSISSPPLVSVVQMCR